MPSQNPPHVPPAASVFAQASKAALLLRKPGSQTSIPELVPGAGERMRVSENDGRVLQATHVLCSIIGNGYSR